LKVSVSRVKAVLNTPVTALKTCVVPVYVIVFTPVAEWAQISLPVGRVCCPSIREDHRVVAQAM